METYNIVIDDFGEIESQNSLKEPDNLQVNTFNNVDIQML